jgi:hypothetical protein
MTLSAASKLLVAPEVRLDVQRDALLHFSI